MLRNQKLLTEVLAKQRFLFGFLGLNRIADIAAYCKHPVEYVIAESDCHETHRTCLLCETTWKTL